MKHRNVEQIFNISAAGKPLPLYTDLWVIVFTGSVTDETGKSKGKNMDWQEEASY